MIEPVNQRIAAVVFDFDKTLIPGHMQAPLFKQYNIKEEDFWNTAAAYRKEFQNSGRLMDRTLSYLNLMIRYANNGTFPGLNNSKLEELGKGIEFYPGLPGFFENLQQDVKQNRGHNITLEYYVLTSGNRPLVMGSKIAPYLTACFGCEFVEDLEKKLIIEVALSVSYTEKTQFLFMINKGLDKDVNEKVLPEQRRIPFTQMVYVGDGFTDVPGFSLVKDKGGYCHAVYNPSILDFTESEAAKLFAEERVHSFAAADYNRGSKTYNTILSAILRMKPQQEL